MKKTRLTLIFIFMLLCVGLVFSLTSCEDDEDIYTKEDVNSLIAELKTALTEKMTKSEAAIAALKAEYTAKVAELEKANNDNESAIATLNASYTDTVAELEAVAKVNTEAFEALKTEYEADLAKLQKADADNAAAIETLTSTYESKVAELEASDKANAEALEALKTEYEADLAKLQKADADNAAAIETLTSTYESKVAELEASHKANAEALEVLKIKHEKEVSDLQIFISQNTAKIASIEKEMEEEIANAQSILNEKISNIETIITSLNEADVDNTKRIAVLESQMEALLSAHEHTYGEWINFSGNDNVFCENRLFYRMCTECNVLEWKGGTYRHHIFTTIKTPPTCTSMGFDENTCQLCGYYEKVNYTEITNHTWESKYSYDSESHWLECSGCGTTKNKDTHTVGNNGLCITCEKPFETEGILYSLSSDNSYAEVVAYNGSSLNVVISDEYNGKPVRAVSSDAFISSNIVYVYIPDSVTEIGETAFKGCTYLKTVNIGDGVITIGQEAFSDCISLTSIIIPDKTTIISTLAFYNCISLKEAVIGNQVTTIEDCAFENCTALTDVTLGKNIKSIGRRAFYSCTSLKSIEAPDTLTTIEDYAFYCCSALSDISIPDSITHIGKDAFSGCDALNYSVYSGDKYLGNTNNPYVALILATNDSSSSSTILQIHKLTKIIASEAVDNCFTEAIIPDNVTVICNNAFAYCNQLRKITLGKSVNAIGYEAFHACYSMKDLYITDIAQWCNISYGGNSWAVIPYENLYLNNVLVTDLIIPESVTKINNCAFWGCDSLTSITISNNVTTIGEDAFMYCSNLKSVNIGEGVTTIGDWAFMFCLSLTNISVDINNTSYKSIDGNLYTKDGKTLIQYAIGKTDISFAVPTSVTTIGISAFRECQSLTIISISDNVTSIEPQAFEGCSNLTEVTIGINVTEIGARAFWACSLTSVTFKNPTGWWCSDDWDDTTGVNLLTGDLSSKSTAATYLNSNYSEYYWKRT